MFAKVITFIISCGIYASVSSEPVCSKFHYEEKLLEKVIRVQLEMENFLKQFKSMNEDFDKDMNAIKVDMETFKTKTTHYLKDTSSKLEEKQERVLDNLVEIGINVSTEMTTLKEGALTPMISFRARSPADMTPSAGSTIIYKTVEENEGSGYNSETGVFTAPIKGLYSFSINICASPGDHVFVSMLKDGTQLSGTTTSDDAHFDCNSLISAVLLEKGDMVWIKCTGTGTLNDRAGHFWNMFSGVLIHL